MSPLVLATQRLGEVLREARDADALQAMEELSIVVSANEQAHERVVHFLRGLLVDTDDQHTFTRICNAIRLLGGNP